MKPKIIALVLCAVALCYTGYVIYEVKSGHPYKLIYASVYGNWEFFDSRLPPLPFRDRVTQYELRTRPISSYDTWPGFELLPYTILTLKDVDKYQKSKHQKKLEKIVDSFLDRGLDLDKKSARGCTSLQLSVIARDLEAVNFLISRKASILENLGSKSEELCEQF